jgi:hypothetical protein
MPKSASIVAVPSPYDDFLISTGDVKVTFSDGHTELWTHSADCHTVKMSADGSVGWIRMEKKSVDVQRMTVAGKDTLVIRSPDGTTHELPPFDDNVAIMDFRFMEGGRAVAIRSMGHHGPSSFVKYDVATGAVLDSRGTNYTPYNDLPAWAKPLAEDLKSYPR